MGLLTRFINSQIGGIGAAVFGVHRKKKFDTTNNYKFLSFLEPGTIVLQGPVIADYTSGGIQGATKSFWTHVVLYSGSYGAELVRTKYPNLLNRTRYPIPQTILDNEFVEATLPRCRIGSMSEYLNDKIQMLAFKLPYISEIELSRMLYYAYSRNGTPYDVGEIVSDVFPHLNIKHNPTLHGCSSLVATSFCHAGLSVTPPSVAPYEAFPRHFNDFLYPKKEIKIATWNY